jgi:hypothetical protein
MTAGERIVAKLKEMPHLTWLLQSSKDIENLIDAEIKADREADAQKAAEELTSLFPFCSLAKDQIRISRKIILNP